MIKNLKKIYKSFPKSIRTLTLIHLLFVARTTLFVTRREVGDYSTGSGGATILVLLVISISLFVILNNLNSFVSANKKIGRLIIFYTLCIASCLWAGVQIVIFFKAFEVLCNLYLMYIIATKIGNTRQLLLYIIILSTATSYMEVLSGIINNGIFFIHTNSYTMSAMIGFLLGVQAIRYNIFKTREIRIFLWLNFIAIIAGTSSATYISFILGFIILYSSNKKGYNLGKLILSCILALSLYYVASDMINEYIFYGKNQEDIESGTGRSLIFDAAINSWKERPILGHGYIVGERNLGVYGLGINVLSCHNSYLSVLVNTGIIGMVVFASFVLNWIYKILVKYKQNVYAIILFPAVVASLVNCLSFPGIGSDWNYVGSLIFLMYIMTNVFINNKIYRIDKNQTTLLWRR